MSLEQGRPVNGVGLFTEATAGKWGPGFQGQQFAASWEPGKNDEKPILTTEPAASLWRVSVFGDVLLRVTWGTVSTFSVENIRAPFVAALPGRVSISAVPRSPGDANRCLCTLTPATSGGAPLFRAFADSPGEFNRHVYRVTALNAASVEVAGVVVSLSSGESLPVFAGSELLSGSVILDLAP